MSSASVQPPRTKSPADSRPPGPARHSLFLPILIYLIGASSLSYYQVMALGDQETQLTHTGDLLDARVKHAGYEKAKFFHIVRDVLQLSDKDPNAEIVATRFKLHRIAEVKPELLNAGTPADIDLTNSSPFSVPTLTNAAPVNPSTPEATAPSAH